MSKMVVDASVAAKWLVAEPLADKALALLGGDDELIAPDLFLPEVVVSQHTIDATVRQRHGGSSSADRQDARVVGPNRSCSPAEGLPRVARCRDPGDSARRGSGQGTLELPAADALLRVARSGPDIRF